MSGKVWLLIGLAMIAHGAARADTLLLDEIDASGRSDPERPSRGMTMERVEASFGTPAARRAAVGDPPISRWEYPGFVVYFERDRVIHAVVKQQHS